jgi:hypothetical protein
MRITKLDRGTVAVLTVALTVLSVMVLIVVMGVNRPNPPTFVPTAAGAAGAGGKLVGPTVFTLDASAPDRWQFFSFEQGGVVQNPDALGWDLAFRRFQVIANGGQGFAGDGGIADLGEASFDQIETVPESGYEVNTVRSDTVNAAVRDWYDYSYLSHLLSPKPRVYAVRTAEGRFAKLQFVGYYCPGAIPGCMTFRYVYQGAGGHDLRPGLATVN